MFWEPIRRALTKHKRNILQIFEDTYQEHQKNQHQIHTMQQPWEKKQSYITLINV